MLTWPKNRYLITQIKAAITAGIRPCSMIFHEQPTDPWIPFDFKLIEAYQRLQDETCPKCGHPVWLCRSGSPNVMFHVRETYCQSERAMREFEDSKKPKNERTKGKDKREWGRIYYTEPAVPHNIDAELPTRREFYEEIAKTR